MEADKHETVDHLYIDTKSVRDGASNTEDVILALL
jgi:hypothetical protein